eukprot:g46439.t1
MFATIHERDGGSSVGWSDGDGSRVGQFSGENGPVRQQQLVILPDLLNFSSILYVYFRLPASAVLCLYCEDRRYKLGLPSCLSEMLIRVTISVHTGKGNNVSYSEIVRTADAGVRDNTEWRQQ